MPLLNFKKQFVEPIREGTKNHTIRATRKIPVKAGDKLYLYCGARTKQCFKVLQEPVTCTKVEDIRIDEAIFSHGIVHIDGNFLSEDERERLAQADGFQNFRKMMAFWDGRLPFTGQIIHWR